MFQKLEHKYKLVHNINQHKQLMSIKQEFLDNLIKQAQTNPKTILFPEADLDELTLQATLEIANKKTAIPVLLSSPNNSSQLLNKLKKISHKIPDNLSIIDPATHSTSQQDLAEQLFQIRKHKNLNRQEAKELIQSPYYHSVMLLHNEEVDGIVTGRVCPTKVSIKPAFQILKPKYGYNLASSFFIMLHKSRLLIFADCAININPSAEELKQIAIDTATTAKKFNIDPRIAFLSFSTNNSSNHPEAQKIQKATEFTKEFVNENNLPFIIDGDIQLDAALVPEIAAKKFPNNNLQGQANILIFPNLFAGNIGYKMAERLGNVDALGPIIQGLSRPLNDLSRGSKLEDIINLAAITTIEAQ